MNNLIVCIGSACHIKGSYDVIDSLKSLIKEHNLDDKIELVASFCLKNCTEAVAVQTWDNRILSVSKDNVIRVFEDEVIPYL